MAVVARSCAMRLASSSSSSSCSWRLPFRRSTPIGGPPAPWNPRSRFVAMQRRPSGAAVAMDSWRNTASSRLAARWMDRPGSLEMARISKGAATIQTAAALPETNEEEELISGGSLRSDGGGGGDRGRDGGGGGGGGHGDHHRGSQNPVLAWYMKLLEERPVTTKAITAAMLTFFGDIFTQLVIEKSSGIDIKRIAVITSLGFMLVGPTLHFWYLTLSKVVKVGGVKGTGIRLLLDQLFFSPLFIGVFFVCLLTLEGRPSDIGPKLTRDWPSAVVTNWKLWIPFQFINFMFVPQQLQVAFANVIALVWNAYLSFATHTK